MCPSLISLYLFACLFLALSGLSAQAQQSSLPIALTGFNRDVIFENSNLTSAATFDDGTTAWIEDGLQGFAGLPSATFASRLSNAVTSGSTLYQLQSFTANNVLMLTQANTQNTLTLDHPTYFHALSIAAASTNARFVSGIGTLTLNFEGGLTSPSMNYNARDWWGEGQNDDPNRIFEGGVYRTDNTGSGLSVNSVQMDLIFRRFNLYETTFDLTNIGGTDYSSAKLDSITFNLASGAFHTGIFAVSGTSVAAAPEPGFSALLIATCVLSAILLLRRHCN